MVFYAVVPQIILPYLSFTIYRWDINIRMATIIGLVGGGGVGTLLMQYTRSCEVERSRNHRDRHCSSGLGDGLLVRSNPRSNLLTFL